jgi:hypothetical protein
MEYVYTATTLPLNNAVTHTNVVRLATGNEILSFTNGAPVAFDVDPVYVDAMFQFAMSDIDLVASSLPNDTKIAIYANNSSNLVIRHGMLVVEGEDSVYVVTNSEIDTVALLGALIDPTNWYRVTVKLSSSGDPDYYVQARVQVNSHTVTHANAPGDLFLTAMLAGKTDSNLRLVSFMGNGFLDDVVITRDVPSFGTTASVFSYVIEEHLGGSFNQYITVSTENQYAAGWTNVYPAPTSAWFTNRVDAGTAAMFSPLGADGRTVTAPAPDVSNNNSTNLLKMLLDQAKTAAELPAQFAGMSGADIAWIRDGFGKTPDDPLDTDANNLAFEQAMKLNPYVNEAVSNVITKFTVGSPNSTIVVKALTNGVAYASPSGLTVNILIDSKASLTNAWPAAAGITNAVTQFNALGEATNTFVTPSGRFFRARILPQ